MGAYGSSDTNRCRGADVVIEIMLPFKATGKLVFDPGIGTKQFDPWWALLACDEQIIEFYRWILLKHGVKTMPNALWGPHISVIKGEEPKIMNLWGVPSVPVEFWYTNSIRWHDRHAWLDVWSPQMSLIREDMGLPPKCFFHMTIGNIT